MTPCRGLPSDHHGFVGKSRQPTRSKDQIGVSALRCGGVGPPAKLALVHLVGLTAYSSAKPYRQLGRSSRTKAVGLLVVSGISRVSSCCASGGWLLSEIVFQRDTIVSRPLRTTTMAQIERSAAHRL